MRQLVPSIHWAAIVVVGSVLLTPPNAIGQPVIFSVETHRGGDTMYVGERGHLSFNIDGQGADIYALVYPLEFSFGAGNLLGSTSKDVTLEFQFRFLGGFGGPAIDSLNGTDPDTLLIGLVSWGNPWITSGVEWVFHAAFQPKAPGQIQIDSIMVPPANVLNAMNLLGETFPVEWHAPSITVLPCPNVLGDVNQNGQVTSADIIAFVSCVFQCGAGTFPVLKLGDVNCSENATVTDAILLVNYVFKAMPLPFCCTVVD